MDPLWCTVNAKILLFLVDKSVNIHDFSANYIRTTRIAKIFLHTIIIISRRGTIRTTKIFCQNYEYTGHNLDTIIYIDTPAIIRENVHFLLCQPTYLWALYPYNPPLFLDTTFIVTFYFFRAQYIGGVFRQCYNEIINHYA